MATCESCGQTVSESALRCPSCGAPLASPSSTNPASYAHSDDLAGFEAYTPEPHLVSDRPYRIPTPGPGWERQEPPDDDFPDAGQDETGDTNNGKARTYRLADTSIHLFNSTLATPLLIEILLSLFLGIFGVGWLLAGEIPTGILLLAGSFLIYLPLVVVSFILAITSVGLSLLCTGPLAIGVVCLNAFLLQNRLKRKQAASIQRGQGNQSGRSGSL
jgi:hypothetical protein